MTKAPIFTPAGVIPACLLPFTNDFEVNIEAYLAHLMDVASVDGVTGITVNGHASEVTSCTISEQQRILSLTAEALEGKLPIVNGVYTDNTLEAARIAKMAEAEGAAALLVFPPNLFSKGVQLKDDVAITHFKAIANACDLPIVAFQYPYGKGAGYRVDTLLKLGEEVPSIVAIKDFCGDPALHERTVRALHNAPHPIAVLTTHSSWLLQSLSLGCDGILSGSGSVVAALQVQLWRAFRASNLEEARRVSERIFHWTRAVYIPPAFDNHQRMKVALTLMGKLDSHTVRPPLSPLTQTEIETIAKGLKKAGLLPGNH